MQKEWLEDLVVRETMKLIQDDAVIDKIVQLVMDVQNQENTTILLLEKQLREINKKLENLMKAIEDGLYTRTTKDYQCRRCRHRTHRRHLVGRPGDLLRYPQVRLEQRRLYRRG